MKLTRLTNQTPAMTSRARSSHHGRYGVIWKSAGSAAITVATQRNWISRRGTTATGRISSTAPSNAITMVAAKTAIRPDASGLDQVPVAKRPKTEATSQAAINAMPPP